MSDDDGLSGAPSVDPARRIAGLRRVQATIGLLFAVLVLCTLYYGLGLPQSPGMRKPSIDLIPRFPLWTFAVQLDWLVPRNALWVMVALIVLVAAWFGAYGAALVLSWRHSARSLDARWAIGGSWLLFLASVVFLPNVDGDIYNYIMRGRVAAVYGQNPYRVIVDEFPDDPLYRFAEPRYTGTTTAAKLPAWQPINAGLAWLAGNEPVHVLLLYRTAFFLFNAANIVLVWLILRRLRPDLAVFGVILYGWNPIVIAFGQSKTDSVMAFYFLMGIYLLARGRDRWAAVFLSLSVWVKLVTLPMLGAAWLGDLKLRNWKRLALTAAIFCLVTLAVYLPYTHSPDLLVRHVTQMDNASSTAPTLVRTAFLTLFVLLTVAVGVRQNGSVERLIFGWGIMALYFAMFLTKISLSWYMIVPIAIVAVSADWRLAAVTGVCSFGCFLINLRQGVFSREFPPPDLISVPRYVVYLALPATALLLILAYNLRSRRLVQSGPKS